jgi:diaminohydroxyphosphoribosylaminopyrimidine deaminase/5-amino-6-(5-phosphoribosylamino)uracil reductase
MTGKDAPATSETAVRQRGGEIVRVAEKEGRLDLREVLQFLATRGITRLMVEGGPAVASALLEADLIDEAVFFHSPIVIGEEGVPALEPRATELLDQHLNRVSREPVGPDRQETYERGSDHV